MKRILFGLLIGFCIAVPTSIFAASASYMLVKAIYPILVNDAKYIGEDLPVLNYKGNTYVPLHAFGDIMDSTVIWNQALKQVEITNYPYATENSAFRNVTVTGANGVYAVTGEGRVFEAALNYIVTDGHTILVNKQATTKEGGVWSAFTLQINIPKDQQPHPGLLTLQLFEISAKDGSKTNRFNVPLEIFR